MSARERETVAVVAPLREELGPLLRQVADVRRIGLHRYSGRLGSRELVLGWTGDGWSAARAGLAALLAAHRPSRLVVLGVAGGLSPGLDAGSLAVACEVRDGDGVAPAPDPEWIVRAVELAGAREAVVFSHDRILVRADEKAELGRRLLAESAADAAVVDLETAVYARTAAAHGVPYTAIRAVSDTVDEDLPLDFNRFLDDGGRTRRARVALYALGRPWVVGRLLGLRSRLRGCAEALSEAARLVLRDKGGRIC
ncbi:MAG TPA: hypothetical protein VGG06_09105 [Thermoanaerobaculia bacterium]|jgi:adenosylhomocysteine nucleosidase